jgi:hypothetical protein
MARFGHGQTDPIQILKNYARTYFIKVASVAAGWIPIYFISHPFRREGDLNVLMLFAPMIGALAGVVAGWHLAQDAVEDSSMHGVTLWVILVVGAAAPMWIMDAILNKLTGWPWTFGGFMMLTAGTLMALASAVWVASAQE